jgi:multidrug efflux pump subunit AcrB
LLYGVSKYIFSALGLSLVLSLFASYVVAMTVVPLFCAKLIKAVPGHESIKGEKAGTKRNQSAKSNNWGHRFNVWFNHKFTKMLDGYERLLNWGLRWPLLTVLAIIGLFLISLLLYPFVGKSYFPRTDPSQFVINFKAPSGTRLELTEKLVAQVEDIVRGVVPKKDLKIIVSNMGITPGFSSILSPNSCPSTAFILVGLNEGHALSSFDYMDRVRARLRTDLPQTATYFQTGGLTDAILNQGMPAPLDIQVSSMDMEAAYHTASRIAQQVRALPDVNDVLIPQDIDYPSLQINIDRERASELGLTAQDVVDSLITALTSNGMLAPSYWIDPKTGNNYLMTVQYFENTVNSLPDLGSMPLRSPHLKKPTRLDSVVHITRIQAPTEVDHYQIRRTIDVYVAPKGEDLSRLYALVQKIIAGTPKEANMTVNVRGSVQSMRESFKSFGVGLILSVILVYLILVAQFRSFVDPFLILLAIPPGLTGVLLILFLTHTPISVMALMGILLMVGISVSDSILIVEFTNRLRAQGHSLRDAVRLGPRVRLRPVLMTTLATLIGLIPMALKLGTGGEAYAPLARALIGGLAVSALQAIFLVPACYYLIKRREEPEAPVEGETRPA